MNNDRLFVTTWRSGHGPTFLYGFRREGNDRPVARRTVFSFEQVLTWSLTHRVRIKEGGARTTNRSVFPFSYLSVVARSRIACSRTVPDEAVTRVGLPNRLWQCGRAA